MAQHPVQVVQRIGLGYLFVAPPAGHARKAQRDARLMAGGGMDALKGDLKDMFRGDLAHRSKALQRIFLHPSRDFTKLFVRQAGIGLCEGNQFVSVPDRESEIGEEGRAPPCVGDAGDDSVG